MLNASILSIGDEILIGQIQNTNSKWIAEKITQIGCSVKKISSVGDNYNEITSEIDTLLNISDLLIITGGLGPTHDDITKQVLCDYFNDYLVENSEWLEKIRKQFSRRGIQLSKRNQEQALIPKNAKLLYNEIGTAPGMLFANKGKYVISLPGVPQEVYCIMQDEALKFISDVIGATSEETILYKNIQTAGIAESTLADLLQVDEKLLGKSTIAFLPSFAGVKLRIGAFGNNQFEAKNELERIKSHIISKAKQFIISEDEKSYSQILGELLTRLGKTIAVAESCTGGMLGAEITSVSGSSKYFLGGMQTYSNDVKINNLGVSSAIIDSYGAVSRECAEAMSECIREKLQADIGISITGIAGPEGGTPEKPVGTVYFAISDENKTYSDVKVFSNSREIVRERAVQNAILMLIKLLHSK